MLEWFGRHADVCLAIAVGCYLIVAFGIDLPRGIVEVTGGRAYARNFLHALVALFVLVPAVFGPQDVSLFRRFLRWRPVVYLGVVSYGVYLWHNNFLEQARVWCGFPLFNGSFVMLLTITLSWSLVFATASYYLVELPILRLKDRPLFPGGAAPRMERDERQTRRRRRGGAGVRDPATTFPCFDGLRAIAAITVVLHHVSFPTGKMVNGLPRPVLHPPRHRCRGVLPHLGLPALPAVRRRRALEGRPGPSVRRFFRRRLLRIFPAYWLALVCVIVFFGLQMPVAGTRSYLEYFTLLQIYDTSARAAGGISQAWTLSVELSFYAFLPLYAWVMRRIERAIDRADARVRVELAGLVAMYAVSVAFRESGVHARTPGRVHDLGIYWLPGQPRLLRARHGPRGRVGAGSRHATTIPPFAETVGRAVDRCGG